MGKLCPLVGKKVVYLECLECEDRVCDGGGKPRVAQKDQHSEMQNKERIKKPKRQ